MMKQKLFISTATLNNITSITRDGVDEDIFGKCAELIRTLDHETDENQELIRRVVLASEKYADKLWEHNKEDFDKVLSQVKS